MAERRCQLHPDEVAQPGCRWCPLPADAVASGGWVDPPIERGGPDPAYRQLRARLREECDAQGVPMIGSELDEDARPEGWPADPDEWPDGMGGEDMSPEMGAWWACQAKALREDRDFWLARARRAEGMLRQISNLVVAGERRLGKAAVLLANWRKAQEDSDG